MNKWRYGMLILFVIMLSILFFSCEKTCLTYSCEVVSANGDISQLTVSSSNANVYGIDRCECIDEVNRYFRNKK